MEDSGDDNISLIPSESVIVEIWYDDIFSPDSEDPSEDSETCSGGGSPIVEHPRKTMETVSNVLRGDDMTFLRCRGVLGLRSRTR